MNFEAMKVDIERTVVAEIREQQEAARRAMAAQWGQARAQLRVDEANRRAEADRVDYWKTGADAGANPYGGALSGQRFSERYADRINLANPLKPKCNHMGYVHQIRGGLPIGHWACGGCGKALPMPQELHEAAHALASAWNKLPEIERPRDGLELAEWYERRKAEKARNDAEKARAVEHLAALQRQQEARRHELQATLSDMPGIDAAPKSTRINGPVPVFEDAKWSTLGGFSSDRGRGLLTVAGGDHRLGRFGVPLGEV